MPTYRELEIIEGTEPGDPPAENVLARHVATRWSAHQQFAAQDRIIGSGRRIVMSLGAGPVADTFVPDTNPATASTDPDYPDETTEYPVGRLDKVCLTPGSVYEMMIVALPSGPTQRTPGSGWEEDVRKGVVKIAVTLTDENSNTVTMTREVEIEPSQLQYGKKPDGDGESWKILKLHTRILVPDGFDDVPATTAKWSGPFTLSTITLSHIASPRVVDLSVYELPRRLVKDISVDDWSCHMYAQGGEPYQVFPYLFAVEQASSADPSNGIEHILEVARQTAEQLGPMIFFGSSWDQDDATILNTFSSASHGGNNTNGVGDNEAPPISVTSTSFVHFLNSAWTSFDAANPGYSIGSGANGRHYRTSDQTLILPNRGVVSVILGVYGKMDSGLSTAWVRFQTAPYCYVDKFIPVASDTYKWHFIEAEIECGTGAEDDVTMQIFWRVGGGGQTWSPRYWGCWYRSDPS